MTAEVRTDRVVETPVWFPAGRDQLFGILTSPDDRPPRTVVVVAAGGWYGTSTARNASVVSICRALAARGVAAFHFDYRGVGESTGVARFTLSEPYTDDLLAAAAMLRDRGVSRIGLVGICYGSWVALLAAPRVPDVAAVALVSFPPSTRAKRASARVDQAASTSLAALARRALGPAGRRALVYDAGARQAARRAIVAKARGRRGLGPNGPAPSDQPAGDHATPPETLAALDHLAREAIPLLFLYSRRAPHFAEFEQWRATGLLGQVLDRAPRGSVDVVAVDPDIEEFTRLAAQQTLSDQLCAWLTHRLAD